MATYCPNQSCNYKLKLSDWRQNCPECNANILYYHMEERLDNEADHVELASAATRKWMNRAKAAMLGTPLSKFRFSLLFGPLFLPAIPVGVWAAWSLFAQGDFMQNFWPTILNYIDLDNPDALLETPMLALAVVGLVIAFPLTWLAGLITMAFSCGPKWFGRNLTVSSIGLAGAALCAFGAWQFNLQNPGIIQGFIFFGIGGLALAYALLLCINVIIRARGGIPVEYTQCWIAFTPEDEVYGFIKETGGTVRDFRRMKAEEAGDDVPPKRQAGEGELACAACGDKIFESKENFDKCEYCRNHAIALEKLEKQKRRIVEIELKKLPRAERQRLQTGS